MIRKRQSIQITFLGLGLLLISLTIGTLSMARQSGSHYPVIKDLIAGFLMTSGLAVLFVFLAVISLFAIGVIYQVSLPNRNLFHLSATSIILATLPVDIFYIAIGIFPITWSGVQYFSHLIFLLKGMVPSFLFISYWYVVKQPWVKTVAVVSTWWLIGILLQFITVHVV